MQNVPFLAKHNVKNQADNCKYNPAAAKRKMITTSGIGTVSICTIGMPS